MSDRIKIGILGCGVITQRILQGLKAVMEPRGAAISAICDLSDANLDTVEREYAKGPLHQFKSFDEMLRQCNLDAVMIATPISMHYDNVKTSLEAGCHVYCHKTLAQTPEQCKELCELANAKGLRLAASPGQVLLPAYRRAKEIVASGKLGALVSIDAVVEASPHRWEAERVDESPAEGQPFSWEWYHRQDSGGGPLDDMFVYPLAFLTETLGDVSAATVQSRLVTPNIQWKGRTVVADTPDAYCGTLNFDGVPATFRASFSANTSRIPWGFITIRGTEAGLEIEKVNDLEYRVYLTPNGGTTQSEQLNAFDATIADAVGNLECHLLTDIAELLDAVIGGRDVRGATPANAARIARALTLIRQSAAAGGNLVTAG